MTGLAVAGPCCGRGFAPMFTVLVVVIIDVIMVVDGTVGMHMHVATIARSFGARLLFRTGSVAAAIITHWMHSLRGRL